MQRLTVFISSTVKDFGPIRSDLRSWFVQQQIDVRMSEHAEFPVDDAVTSHDACLRAIEGCHLVVVLIGARYGGSYANTPKSITRREYDEAVRLGLPVIVLVPREVAARAELQAKGEIADAFGKQTAEVIGFLDHVRKGHVNNWVHMDWDATLGHAKRVIRSRMNALFVRHQAPHKALVERAMRLPAYAGARLKIDQAALVLQHLAAPPEERVDGLLAAVAQEREALLGFHAEDRWNLAVYVPNPLDETKLRVLARRAHPDIPLTNREWKVGEGHVGAAWQIGQTLVAADLTVTSSWVGARDGDEANYRSAIAEPVLDLEATIVGILVATSSRMDQFRDPEQPEVATLGSLAIFASRLMQQGSR